VAPPKRGARATATSPSLFDDGPPPPRHVAELHASVALNRPVPVEFTYAVPPELAARAAPGVRVVAPFGNRREIGVVVATSREAPADLQRVKPIASVLDEEPLVGARLLELTKWVAARYACSWGEALHAVLPAALKRESESAKVVVASAAPGVGEAELAELEA
jgi:primosomal protein N' (replication factor Y) (superfamily II helicase)